MIIADIKLPNSSITSDFNIWFIPEHMIVLVYISKRYTFEYIGISIH